MSLNKVMLIGRLGKDPKLNYTQNGAPVTSFSIATDESYNNKNGERVERTEWHNIVVWGRQAEPCANYLHKGSLVYVEGSLQTRKWQAQDGSDRYSTDVKSQRVQFLDTKKSQGGQQNGSWGGQQSNAGYNNPFPSDADGMDDVPF